MYERYAVNIERVKSLMSSVQHKSKQQVKTLFKLIKLALQLWY